MFKSHNRCIVAAALLAAAIGGANGAVTYSSANVPLAIPDNSSPGVTSSLVITDMGTISDLNVGLTIEHQFRGDLVIKLTSPQGTSTSLVNRRGGAADNFNAITLDDDALAPRLVLGGSGPFPGSYVPEASLSVFDNSSATGAWKLKVTDASGADIGALHGWSLIVNGVSYDSTGAAQPIPDLGFVESTISVPSGPTVSDIDVRVDITHTFTGDLVITLEGPGGQIVTLVNRRGGNGNDFNGTVFDDEAVGPAPFIALVSDIFGTVYRPESPLSAFDGEDLQGTWLLNVADVSGLDTGRLVAWSLIAEASPGHGVPEPASLALVTLGLAGCLVARAKRRQRLLRAA